jgi:phosphate-selective porin OprO/OprP
MRQRRFAPVGLLIGVAALTAAPRATWAQASDTPAANQTTPVDQATVATAELPAASAPASPPSDRVAPTNVAVSDLQQQLQDTDQRARIAERKLELFEEKIEQTASESPTVNAAEQGFFLRSADKRTYIQLRGLLQLDTRWYEGNDTVNNNVAFNDNDAFLIRRFRPEIGGTLVGLADFIFSPDFAGAATTVFDAYVDVHPFSWLRLRVGKQKEPLGLERLQSEGGYPFMERALDQNLTPGRDIGAALWGDIGGGLVSYNIGLWEGFPDNANNSGGAAPDSDTNHAKDVMGRLFFQPLKRVEGAGTLGIGIAASTGNHKGRPPVAGAATLVPTYRSSGQLSIFSYAVGPATDVTGAQSVFAHLRETRINPQLYYYRGSVGVLGEYVWTKQGVQKGNATADLANQGYHLSASYVLGGTASYDGATPTFPFDTSLGHYGCLEIAGRYEALIIDEDSFDRTDPTGGSYARGFANPISAVSKAQGWTGAAVYSPSRTLRFYLNFAQTFFKDGGPIDPMTRVASNRVTENLLFARAHVKF